jgi:uncharacterized membrane protein YfcA
MRRHIVAAVAGLVTGAAAGLVGVGGGEFRMPVLAQVLKFPLRIAASVNLVIGLATVVVSLWRRWGQITITHDDLRLAAIMAVTSIAGAILGSLLRKRVHVSSFKWAVCVYLLLAGAWMLYEALVHAEHVLMNPSGTLRFVLAGSVAFVIAIVSASFGVAGGEMRIPALMYLFDIPIKAAGTLSLMASIPTVATGAITDRRIGHLPNSALWSALVMAGGSIVGVFIGASFVATVDAAMLKGILGAILILATVRMLTAAETSATPKAPRETVVS